MSAIKPELGLGTLPLGSIYYRPSFEVSRPRLSQRFMGQSPEFPHMERIEAMVPPPLEEGIEEYRERQGFENKSQAIRALLRRGLGQ